MINRYPPDDGDRDIEEMLPEIEELIDRGATVYLKWRCPGCGERCVADEPNKVCIRGYRHTEREDGSPCGAWYRGRRFGYLVVSSMAPERRRTLMTDETKPSVKLIGEDGNAFAILGRCRRAAKEAGWSDDQWDAFHREATAGDYDHLLATVMEHFEIE